MNDMKFDKMSGDKLLSRLFVSMWVLVSLFAVYIMFSTLLIVAYPVDTIGLSSHIPEAVEHLLASVVVCLGFGAASEYMSNK